jgi:cytochrome c2
MRASWGLFGLGLAVAVVVGIAGWAVATPQAGTPFKALYGTPKEGTDLAKAMPCQACHAAMPPSKTNLNPYGVDLQKAAKGTINEAAFKAIEALDSDKDGFKNLDEIKAGTLPGDPKSKPKK